MAAQTPSESCLHRNAEPSSPNRFWYRLICRFPDTSIATIHRSVSAAGPSQLHFCPHSHTECCADSQRIAHLACLSRGSDAMAFAMHLMPSTPIPFLYRKIVSSVFRATPCVWVCMKRFIYLAHIHRLCYKCTRRTSPRSNGRHRSSCRFRRVPSSFEIRQKRRAWQHSATSAGARSIPLDFSPFHACICAPVMGTDQLCGLTA